MQDIMHFLCSGKVSLLPYDGALGAWHELLTLLGRPLGHVRSRQ